jgi:hypothetical protein
MGSGGEHRIHVTCQRRAPISRRERCLRKSDFICEQKLARVESRVRGCESH